MRLAPALFVVALLAPPSAADEAFDRQLCATWKTMAEVATETARQATAQVSQNRERFAACVASLERCTRGEAASPRSACEQRAELRCADCRRNFVARCERHVAEIGPPEAPAVACNGVACPDGSCGFDPECRGHESTRSDDCCWSDGLGCWPCRTPAPEATPW